MNENADNQCNEHKNQLHIPQINLYKSLAAHMALINNNLRTHWDVLLVQVEETLIPYVAEDL